MREIVRLFSQQESRDELGIGQIRDALSDSLFPGTSTLHTRARYMLLIPWCFRYAASHSRDASSMTSQVDKTERSLIGGLRAARNASADVDGLLGSTAGEALKNLPSAVYWSALRQYGILAEASLDREDAAATELSRRMHRAAAAEEDEPVAWHTGGGSATLPPVPEGFPRRGGGGFAMSESEAGWLRDRMLQGAPGSALAHLLTVRPSDDSGAPWADPAMQSLHGEPRVLLEHARRFSTAMYGAALLYNVLLADAYAERGFDRVADDAEKHRPLLDRWGAEMVAFERASRLGPRRVLGARAACQPARRAGFAHFRRSLGSAHPVDRPVVDRRRRART